MGKRGPKPEYTERLTVMISKQTEQALKEQAAEQQASVGSIVRRAIDKQLQERD